MLQSTRCSCDPSFPHLITLTEKKKKLNPQAVITCGRPTRIGQILKNYKHLVKQDAESCQGWVRILWPLCTSRLLWETQQINCFINY